MQWGRRAGARVQIEVLGGGVLIATLRLLPVLGTGSRYNVLDGLVPGGTVVVPWILGPNGRPQDKQHALVQGVRRRLAPSRFFSSGTPQGLEVYLCE